MIEENHREYSRASVELAQGFPPELGALIRGHMAMMAEQFGLQTQEVFERQLELPLATEDVDSDNKSSSQRSATGKSPALALSEEEEQAEQKRVVLEMAPKVIVSGATFVVQQDFSQLCRILLYGTAAEIEAERVAKAAMVRRQFLLPVALCSLLSLPILILLFIL